MLGILMYEGIEIVYYTGKIAYEATTGIYSYVYGVKEKTEKTENRDKVINELKKLSEINERLLERIERLERGGAAHTSFNSLPKA